MKTAETAAGRSPAPQKPTPAASIRVNLRRRTDHLTHPARHRRAARWIYKGNYDADGVPIVIKVLRPDGVTDETLRRFQREASVLRQLGAQANPNPNLVRFYDHGIVHLSPPNSSPLDKVALPFTVLEYVHGTTLAQIIRHQGTGLAAGRTRRLLRRVAFALTSVHAQNIIHRDLKPSNILVAVDHGTEVSR